MNLAPIPPVLPFWLLAILPLLVAVLLILWVTRRDRKRMAYRKATGDMLLETLQQANAQLSAAVQVEKNAIQTVAVLPEDVDPFQADAALQAAMPGSSIYDRQVLMLHAWEVQKRPQALAALAGMAMADLQINYSILREMFRRVINEGGPVLLGQVVAVLDERQGQLDAWLHTGGLIVGLENAAVRVEGQDADVAARLRATALSLEPRCRELMLRDLRFQIEHRQEDETISPERLAGELAPYCLPRFRELAGEVHAVLDKQEGGEWERAHIWFDKAVLHWFYDRPRALDNFDFDGALDRLCRGLISPDAETSRFAALTAADLLSDYFYDSETYYAALRGALDAAADIHPFTQAHDWLASALDPPEVSDDKLDRAEANLAQAQQALEGTRLLGAITATLDPTIALAELRAIMPDVPVTVLREALIARWEERPAPIWLAALAGLGLEELARANPDVRLVHTCFYWPLKQGPRDLIATIAAEADRLMHRPENADRFARLQEIVAAALVRVNS